MNKNNTQLQEFLDEVPELTSDKEKLSDVIMVLKNIENKEPIDPVFQKKLKTRLENVIELKSWKKKTFWLFLIPVFSFCFIVIWGYISFWWVDFFWQDKAIQIPVISESEPRVEVGILSQDITDQETVEKDMQDDIWVESITEPRVLQKSIPEEEVESSIVTEKLIQETPVIENVQNQEVKSTPVTKSIIDDTPEVEKESDVVADEAVSDINTNILQKDTSESWENSELLELFWEAADFPEVEWREAFGLISDKALWESTWDEQEGISEIWTFSNLWEEKTFTNFCEDLKGKLSEKNEDSESITCKVEESICSEKDYKGSTCIWKEIK